jgi:Flagellar hook-length control protein FliK
LNVDLAPVSLAPALAALERQTDLQHAIAPPRADAVPGGALVQVSDAARFLRSVLDSLPLPNPASAAVSLPLPLLDPALSSPSRSELSGRVRQALEQSGAFYEAHQGRWLQGQFATDALCREPQARFAATFLSASTDAAIAPQDQAAAPVSAASAGASARPVLSVPPALLPLIEQQLQFLASGELRWQGEAWPGQALELRLAQEQPHTTREAARRRVWQTTLRLQLPQLGEIEAQLRVEDADISLRVGGEQHALARLSAAVPQLAQAFDAAGIELKSAVVRAHE